MLSGLAASRDGKHTRLELRSIMEAMVEGVMDPDAFKQFNNITFALRALQGWKSLRQSPGTLNLEMQKTTPRLCKKLEKKRKEQTSSSATGWAVLSTSRFH